MASTSLPSRVNRNASTMSARGNNIGGYFLYALRNSSNEFTCRIAKSFSRQILSNGAAAIASLFGLPAPEPETS